MTSGRLSQGAALTTALYFPYIRVPQSAWFTQVLLYWDRVSTIVPGSLPLSQTGSYMQELREVGLLEWWPPDEAVKTLDHEAFRSELRSLTIGLAPQRRHQRSARVHESKMTPSTSRELEGRGLARRGNPWWRVESRVADLYMAHLALAMSAANPGTTPVSDRPSSISTLGGTHLDYTRMLDAMRYAVITEALPTPSGSVPARELATFKEDHAEKLQRCWRFIDGKLADLAAIPNPTQRQVRLDAITQEIVDEVTTLKEAMKRRRWPRITLVGIGGVLAGAFAAGASAVGSGSEVEIGLGVASGVAALGPAGYAVWQQLRESAFDPRAPLAYSVLASNKL